MQQVGAEAFSVGAVRRSVFVQQVLGARQGGTPWGSRGDLDARQWFCGTVRGRRTSCDGKGRLPTFSVGEFRAKQDVLEDIAVVFR